MSCHGHVTEYIAKNLKVTLVLKNVTIEEIAAIKEFLNQYRKEKASFNTTKSERLFN